MPSRPRITYRRCPSCRVILQASDFRRAAVPFNNERGQLQRRGCPDCGDIAPLMAFQIVEGPESNQDGGS
jgi:hypothetical protein